MTPSRVPILWLHGADAEYGERAAAFAAKLDADSIADFAVDTDDVAVPTVAKTVLERAAGWPGTLHDLRA